MVDYDTLNSYVDRTSEAIELARIRLDQSPAVYRVALGAIEQLKSMIVKAHHDTLDVVPDMDLADLFTGDVSDYAQAYAVAEGYILKRMGMVESVGPGIGGVHQVLADVTRFRSDGRPNTVACQALGIRLAESPDVALVDRVLKETFEMAVRKA
ncbi:hypothetical protein HN698_01345 [Candidatus Woesearchaeota archaeon]|nr:hypothetical protein [Candidatus Woesearchaeota archaeon]MBT7930540.1 hypothetical protein [Candidatus Woesearchaeota archaeon]